MSKKHLYLLFIFALTAFIFSCKKQGISLDNDYKYYSISNVEWKSKKSSQHIDDISYTATEVPIQYYILKNGRKNSKENDSIFLAHSKERIIEIEFEHIESKDLLLKDFTNRSYENSVKYMSFSIKKDFKVVTERNDTIPCDGVHFERNYKITPFKRLLLYFNNINQEENIKLIYNDALFGNGIIEFNFIEQPLKL